LYPLNFYTLRKILLYLFWIGIVGSIALLVFMPSSRYYKAIATAQSINTIYNSLNDDNLFNKDEVKFAKHLLPIPDSFSIVTKVLRIQEFLLDTIAHNQSNDIDFHQSNSASLQYLQDALNKKIIPDCGAYTQMMNLFFYANNIQFRRVGVSNIPDTSIGNHVFSEVYLPQKKQWMFTDMNTNKLSVQDSFGNYLNTQQIQNAITIKNFTSKVFYYANDTIQNSVWKNVLGDEQKCFLPMVDYQYYNADHLSTADKINKLFYPNPWYTSVSHSEKANNIWYWGRIVLLGIALLCGLIYFILGAKGKQKLL
jgi:hypothetical protein